MHRNTIIYHANCPDGVAAAWATLKGLRETFNKSKEDVILYAAMYGEEPPWDIIDGKIVYIVDFSYPREAIQSINQRASMLTVLDHHKTAEKELRGLPYCTFDMNRSGAGLAWDHFFPGLSRPAFLTAIEDRDLWKFECMYTKEICAFMRLYPMTIESMDIFYHMDCGVMINDGVIVLRSINESIKRIAKNAQEIRFSDWNIVLINHCQEMISELLNHILETYPTIDFVMGWWRRSDGVYQYSLRSKGDFDVSDIAKSFGGGGHKNSAGFNSSCIIT